MPKRKTYYGRQTQRKGYYKRRRTGNYNFQPTRQFVPRTMGPLAISESKYFDSGQFIAVPEGTAWTGTEVDPTTLNTLCVPTEGSDINNRIGRKIQVYKLSLRGLVQSTAEADEADVLGTPAIRIVLFQDKQTNGVQAQGEELMQAPYTPDVGVTFTTFQNTANFGRFRMLKDIILRPRIVTAVTDGASTSSQNTSDISFKITVKFKKPVIIKFNATNGGTIGDIVDNSFHLLAQKSNANFAHTLKYTCRTYYKDN